MGRCQHSGKVREKTFERSAECVWSGNQNIVGAFPPQRGRTAAAAERKRRFARLRSTAPPILRLAVKPTRRYPVLAMLLGVGQISKVRLAETFRTPRAARRKSALVFKRSVFNRSMGCWNKRSRSSRKSLAAVSAAARQDLATALGSHPAAKPVAAFAHDFARLVGALHDRSPGGMS